MRRSVGCSEAAHECVGWIGGRRWYDIVCASCAQVGDFVRFRQLPNRLEQRVRRYFSELYRNTPLLDEEALTLQLSPALYGLPSHASTEQLRTAHLAPCSGTATFMPVGWVCLLLSPRLVRMSGMMR